MQKKQKKSSSCKKGFTLVEVLVAMFIFSLMMVAVSDIFAAFVKSYRAARMTQKTLEDAQYAINYMSKTFRTSTLMEISDDDSYVVVYDYSQGKCLRYTFQNGGLFMNSYDVPVSDQTNPIGQTACDAMPAGVGEELIAESSLGSAKFIEQAYTKQEDGGNPAVIGMISVSMKVQPQGSTTPMFVQTSVSLRDYENAVDPGSGSGDGDHTPPKVGPFGISPIPSDEAKVTISYLYASDVESGIGGYLITEDANESTPALDDSRWIESIPNTYAIDPIGIPFCPNNVLRQLHAYVKDNNGNIAAPITSNSVSKCLPDTEPPIITEFKDVPSYTSSMMITGMDIIFTENSGGSSVYCKLTETATQPTYPGIGWTDCSSISYKFTSPGEKTLYPWAKDPAGNISTVESAENNKKKVTIDTEDPVVTAFTVPAFAHSLAIPISSFVATDSSGIAGYLITETTSKPAAGDPNWSSSVPTTYTVSNEGYKTLYAWAKDASGRISASKSASVEVSVFLSGSCSGFVVRGTDSAYNEWATGTAYSILGFPQHCRTPQCSGDPGVLSSDNNVDFSILLGLYDARQACKDVGARLPSRAELGCIYLHKTEYGNNFTSGGYWTSEEIKGSCTLLGCDYSKAYQIEMGTGGTMDVNKKSNSSVRCVSDN